MISIPHSVLSTIRADISRRASSHPQKRSFLVSLCAVVAILLCGAEKIAVSQTAPDGQFGSVNVGTKSPAATIPVTFVMAGTLGSTAVLSQGAPGLDFADAGTGTCTANTAYVAGQTCTVNVTFTPKFAGTRYGAVQLKDISGNVIATRYLQGTGVGPQMNFLPNTERRYLPLRKNQRPTSTTRPASAGESLSSRHSRRVLPETGSIR